MLIKRYLLWFLLYSIFTHVVYGLSQTLPAGVWKCDVWYESYNIGTVGVNPSGDKTTWSSINLTDGKMSDLKLLSQVKEIITPSWESPLLLGTPLPTLDLTAPLAHYWWKQKSHLDLAYGLTESLTLFGNLSYEKAYLDYTDEYEYQSRLIDEAFQALDKTYYRVPGLAKAEHLNDAYVGAKYKLFEGLSVAVKASVGPLLLGHDAEEKTVKDNEQELETGRGYNQIQVLSFLDTTFLVPLDWTFGYIWNGAGYQDFLDNQGIDVEYGDILYFGLDNRWSPFSDVIELVSSMQVLYAFEDKYKGGSSKTLPQLESSLPVAGTGYSDWTAVPESAVLASLAVIELRYKPFIFLQLFCKGSAVIMGEAQGQIYDFPGRLQPSFRVTFGTTLFLK